VKKITEHCSRILFLDISKAFDGVDHTCLLFNQQLGVVSSLLKPFNLLSFSQHSQVVLINRTLSDPKYTSYGVPQGSVLGPLLFPLHVNDIATNINPPIFADDTTIFHFAKRVLYQDLSTLYNWPNFNPSKTAVMTISNQRNVHPLYFSIILTFQKPIHINIWVCFFITVSLGILTYSTFIRKWWQNLVVFAHSLIPYLATLSLLSTKQTYYPFLITEAFHLWQLLR